MPSDKLEARSKKPTAGLVTALSDSVSDNPVNTSSCWICHSPNQALSNTFEEPQSSFGLGTLNWLHLSQNRTKWGFWDDRSQRKHTTTPSTPLVTLLPNALAPQVTPSLPR